MRASVNNAVLRGAISSTHAITVIGVTPVEILFALRDVNESCMRMISNTI